MTADIIHAFGLRGPNLAAFRAAGDIIDSYMRDPEDSLRAMRQHLAAAAQEPTHERGQARVAIAANQLSVALRLAE